MWVCVNLTVQVLPGDAGGTALCCYAAACRAAECGWSLSRFVCESFAWLMPNATGLILLLQIASCVRLKRLRCVCTLIHSFLPSFIHSFIHSFMHACIHSCIHSVIQSFSHSVIQSFSHSFVRSFIHSRSFWLQILCVSIHLDFRSTSGPKWHDWTCFQVHRWYTSLHQTLRSDSGPFWLAQWKRSLHMQKPLSIVESPKPTLFCPSSGSTHFGTDHLSTPQILVLTRVCQYAAGGRPCLVFACWLGGLNLSCAGGDLASYSLPSMELICLAHFTINLPPRNSVYFAVGFLKFDW